MSKREKTGKLGLFVGNLLAVASVALIVLSSLFFVLQKPETARAAVSDNLNFQGRLMNAAGNIVADGYYNVEFKLYDASSGGTNLWTETYYDSNGVTAGNDNRLRIVNGYFSANLGSQTAFGSQNWDQQMWITINIGGTTQTATPTWDGEMSPRLKLTAVPYAFEAATATAVATNNTNAASTNSDAVTISSGNALGATSNSGNIVMDVGTATQTAGTISIGTANTSGISIGRTGVTTTNNGALTVTQAFTANSGAAIVGTTTINTTGTASTQIGNPTGTFQLDSNTLDISSGGAISGATGLSLASGNFTQSGAGTFSTGSGAVTLGGSTTINGSQFTNNGSTLNTAASISNVAGGGNIGTAAATVDVDTTFNVNQTTAGQTLTLPTPTDTTAGRLAYVNNVGSASFTMYGSVIATGQSNAFIWNGSSWVTTVSLSGSVVNTIGTIDSQTKSADGAVISLNAIYLQTADATYPGLVSTGAQTLAGAKTFSSLLTGSAGASISGATTSINASSNFATNINTGTSTGAVSIGNSLAGAIGLTSATTTTITGSSASTSLIVNNTSTGNLIDIQDNGSSRFRIDTNQNANLDVRLIFSGIGTELDSTDNDLTLTSTGAQILLNDTVEIPTLASADTDTLLCRNTSNYLATCSSTYDSSVTLQDAYGNGNSITTTDNRDISFNLADTTTDSDFIIDILGTGNTFEVRDGGSAVLTVADGGAVVLTNPSGSDVALTVNGGTSTGNILVLQDNGTPVFTVADSGGITGLGTYTFSGVATDITTGSGEDLTVVASGAGVINLNDTVIIGTLAAADSDSYVVCRDASSGQLSACDANGSGDPFIQGGNTFGATGVLGTNDAFDLTFETNNTVRATFDDATYQLYLGNGVTSATPQDFTVNATGGSGSNIGGANLILAGGIGTGTGAGGDIIFRVASNDAAAPGATPNSLTTVFSIDADTGNVTSYGKNTTSVPHVLNLVSVAATVGHQSRIDFSINDTSTDYAQIEVNQTGSGSGGRGEFIIGVRNSGTVSDRITVSGDGATTIRASTSTADTLVVNNSTNTGDIVEFQDNGTSVFRIADGGAVTMTGNFSQTGATTFSTGTGAISLNGATTVTGTNTFTTGTGVVSLQGNTNVAGTASFATVAGTTYTTPGSANDVAISTASLYLLDTSAGAQTITGIAAGRNGQQLTLINIDAALNVTLSNNSGSSVAANRITTGTGSDLVIAPGNGVQLVYDATSSLWRVIGTTAVSGGYANTALSNLTTTSINQSLNPNADNTLDLGSSANSWRTVYADTSVLTPAVDTASATTLAIGNVTATAITLGRAGITTTNAGALTVTQAFTANGSLTANGTFTLGDNGDTGSINTSDWDISTTGAMTGIGAITMDGLLTGTAGATLSGATINLNASSNFATNINTGTSTGAVNIGNSLAGTIAIQSASTVDVIGTTTITGLGGGSSKALVVNNSTSTGRIFEAQDNGTAVFYISDGGNIAFTGDVSAGASDITAQRFISDIYRDAYSNGVLIVTGTSPNRTVTLANSGTTETLNLAPKTTGSIRLSAFTEVNSTDAPGAVEKFRVNTPTTTDALANVVLSSSATTAKPLVIQGLASQTANLTEWQSSTGAVLASVGASGQLNLGTASANNGALALLNSTNAFAVTITAPNQTVGSATISVPNTSGAADTFCLLTLNNCNVDTSVTLQDAYTNSSSPATITTADNKNIVFSLADTATDADFIVDILGTGNTFEVRDGGSAVLAVSDGGTVAVTGDVTVSSQIQVGSTAGTLAECNVAIDFLNCDNAVEIAETFNGAQLSVGVNSTIVISPSSDVGAAGVGTQNYFLVGNGTTDTENFTSVYVGTKAQVYGGTTGTIASLTGVGGNVTQAAAGTITQATGGGFSVTSGVASGNITTGYAIQGAVQSANGTITTGVGLNIDSATVTSGTITTNYGAWIQTQTAGGSDYGLRVDTADTQTLWIAGNDASATTAAKGIAFGSARDVTLYRSAADTLTTDDNLNVALDLDVGSQLAVGSGASITSGVALSVNETFTNTSGIQAGLDLRVYTNPGGASTADIFGGSYYVEVSAGASNNADDIRGVGSLINHAGGGNVDSAYGTYGSVYGTGTYTTAAGIGGAYTNQGTGTTTNGYGVFGQTANTSSGTITNAAGVLGLGSQSGTSLIAALTGVAGYVTLESGATAGITNAYALRAQNSTDSSGSANITNAYGLYIEDQTGATNDYGIAIAGADTYALWVGSGGDYTDAANGITFGQTSGTSVNLYRSADNYLKTDDNLEVGTDLYFTKESAHTIKLADSTSANTAGGALTIESGYGFGNAAGGALNLYGGDGGASGGTGGAVNIFAGDNLSGGTGGAVNIFAGDGLAGGAVNIQAGNFGSTYAQINMAYSGTTARTSIGSSSAQTAKLTVTNTLTTDVGLRVVGASGQATNILEVDANDGTDYLTVNQSGKTYALTLAVNSTGSQGTDEKFRVNAPTTVDNDAVAIISAGAADQHALVVQGFAAQSANLQEWQNSSGTTLSYVTSDGGFVHDATTGRVVFGNYSGYAIGAVYNNSADANSQVAFSNSSLMGLLGYSGAGFLFGAGGASSLDTALYRSAATTLRTSGNFVIDRAVTYGTQTTAQSCGVNCTITQANVDNYSALIINATASTLVVSMPDPTTTTAGKVVYVTAADGSNDFTLRLNSGGTQIDISMRENTTATLIWNGSDWTAAGASSSTDLQAAYNNTLTSAGGAELVLNAAGGAADGLTVRNNATTPITGALLEVQTSIGSNLLSVNNNATEYAANGGAESSTFTAWTATPAGGTVTRYTTVGDYVATGTASTSVVTGAVANHGVENTLSTTLTNNLKYVVSFAVRGTTNFSTLDVYYSQDGSATTSCATGKTVTTGRWTRVTCSFTAPSSGITASNSIFIRQSDATARTFYVDNLSVNVGADVNHAADGSVDSALGTNWTAFGTLDALTRDTTTIYDTSGAVNVDTPAAVDSGVRNNLSITPSVSTQYLVTFYAKSSNTFNDIRVRYSRDGGTDFESCVDYNTQSVSTSTWTEITCTFTTDGTTATNPDLIIDQPTSSNRNFYIDALSVTLNTNTANNVQVGGANKGGPTTLFTLDRGSSAPVADNNDAYLGSMYYDTTTGRIQCYEADGWGACGAAPDNIVNLNPEYAGAVLNGTGVGTMTTDFCSDDAALTVNASLCETGEAKNFYKWTSPQATSQTYSIYVTYQLPATFRGFASDDTVQLVGRVDSTTNAEVTYEMFKSTGSAVTQCGTGETDVIAGGGDTANVWHEYGINGNEATGCSFSSSSAGNFVIFKINMKANSNASAYVSTLSFTSTGQ